MILRSPLRAVPLSHTGAENESTCNSTSTASCVRRFPTPKEFAMQSKLRYRMGALLAVLILLITGPAVSAMAQEDSQIARATIAAQASASTLLTTPANLHVEALGLAHALRLLQQTSGVSLVFSESLLPEERTVICPCEDASLEEALDWILDGTGLTYSELRSHIVIEPRPASTPAPVSAGVTGEIVGSIVDAQDSRPLAGVQVEVVTANRAALSGADGRFTLADIPAGPQQLRVQRLGYATVTRSVTVVAGERQVVDIRMEPTALSLAEVVVTVTGQELRRSVANAVGTVGSAEVERAAVTNVQDLLSGRMSGVTVLGNSGQAGAGGQIQLRGVNSLTQGNEPIIYVDGVRVFNGRTATSVAGRQYLSPFNDIDPSDIERIEVVKGPAATTLYGTEASGGVIQIFTKRGREGPAEWSAEITGGFNSMGAVGPSSDPTGLFLRDCQGVFESGIGQRFEDPTCPSRGSWTGLGSIQRYALSVRGSEGSVSYYVSGNMSRERGVLPTGGNDDAGIRANIDFQPAERLNVSVNSSLVKRTVEWYPDGLSANGTLLNISRGARSNFTGGTGCSEPGILCLQNAEIFNTDSYTDTHHYIIGGTATLRPFDGFTSRLSVGYDFTSADISTIIPFGHVRVSDGQYWQTLWSRALLSVDFINSYSKPFGGSLVSTTTFGGQLFDRRSQSTDLQASDFGGPGVPTLTSGALRSINAARDTRVINAGFLVQEQIAWQDRIFLTAGVRVDGNSAFGTNFGLQAYPKTSLSWVISEEGFWPESLGSEVKLRGAFGESGKAPGAFDAVRTWNPIAAENGQAAFTPSQLGNSDLGPERTRELEVGFEATAFDGRVDVDYSYYRQRTSDALIPVNNPPSQGFSTAQLENVGEIFNSGHELMLGATLFRRGEFQLDGRLRYTSTYNEAVDLGGQVITITTNARTFVREGNPVPSYIGRRVTNPDEFADPIFEDDAYLGSPFPNRIISPSASVRYGDWLTVEALGEFQRGASLLNAVAHVNAWQSGWRPCFDIQDKLRAARDGDASALNDVTAIERARCTITGGNRDFSNWVEPSDFFKLRHISATVDLPSGLVPGFNRASVMFAARNLFRSTNYTGTDPESADQRESTFSRRDYYVIPAPRTFTVTIRTRF